VRDALAEDRANNDITTDALVPSAQLGRAAFLAKDEGVIAGLDLAREAFATVDPALVWRSDVRDGDRVSAGDKIASVAGSLAAILRAERVALNFLSHASGVATAAGVVVRLLEGTSCWLRDTRKTLPGLRAVEKYATVAGGATNHRYDLADGVLIKDNHIAALRARDLGISDAVRMARSANPGAKIEIEVTTMDEAREAAESGADELLLDNMTPAEVANVVRELGSPRPALEASGGISADNVREYAQAGVDFVSMGAITHSAPALDISLEFDFDIT